MENVYIESSYGSVYVAELIRKTPGGQTIVKTPGGQESRFDKEGKQMGEFVSKYRYDRIITKEEFNVINAKKAKEKECQAIRNEVEKLTENFGSRSVWLDKEKLLVAIKELTAKVEAY